MARYCFYCGRALSPGEKCSCRDDAKGRSDPGNAPEGNFKSESRHKAAGNPAGTANGQTSGKKSGFWSSARKSASRKKPGAKSQSRSFRYQKSTFSLPDKFAVIAVFRQFSRYFTRPVDTIRQAAQFADKRRTFLLLCLESLLGGLMLLALSKHYLLTALMQLTIVQTGLRSNFLNGFFLFFQGIALTLCLHFLLICLLFLALRFLLRQPVDFIRLMSALSPASFYGSLFVLMAVFAVQGSLIHTALLLAAAFTMVMLVVFLSLRQLSQAEENRLIGITALIMIVFSALVSSLINLIVPVFLTLFDTQTLI